MKDFSLRTAVLVVLFAAASWSLRPVEAAPPHWTCNPAYAGDGYCDCGCGNYDPDCDDTAKPMWNNCTNGYNCGAATDPEGRYSCDATRKVGVPGGWTGPSTYYDADDGCDCNYGEIDPDCADGSATVYNCAAGQVCTTSGTCAAPSAPARPAGTVTTLHFGGMGSTKFEETSSSKLNNTIYKVRLASAAAPGTKIDAAVNVKGAANVQSTYTETKSYLDQYCILPNTCNIYAYSAGASTVQYAIAQNPTRFTGIQAVSFSAGADGGSDLSSWTNLSKLFAGALAPTLTKTTQRALFNHNVLGNMGKTVYRHGGRGHDWYAPWGWSEYYLWAATGFISGEDDGAVGLDSSGGCTSSASRSDMNCTHFTGNVCSGSCTSIPKLDHYEMKMKGLIDRGW